VTFTGRNVQAGWRLVDGVLASDPKVRLVFRHLDLADLEAVASFADRWDEPLHLLVNNAGVMALPKRELSPAGHELQLATNHLGHFSLASGLRRALAAGAADEVVAGGALKRARIVSVSSRGHLRAAVDFDDINFDRRPYEGMIAYGQSKTANILFAVEAARRWATDGIIVNAVHPGSIIDTNLSRNMSAEEQAGLRAPNRRRQKSLSQGAATGLLVATSPGLHMVSGQYFEDCAQADIIDPADPDPSAHATGVASYALDSAKAEKLWALSERLLSDWSSSRV
jgi:NAD(P)-dependent dehydrogenase (short-subunit alcohol dehydrogenase family)